jgi:hypothetical protein
MVNVWYRLRCEERQSGKCRIEMMDQASKDRGTETVRVYLKLKQAVVPSVKMA